MTVYKFDENTQAMVEKSVVPIGIFRIADGAVAAVAASEGLCRMFGYTGPQEAAEKLSGSMVGEVHPDDAASVAKITQGFLKEDKPYRPVCRVMASGGYRLIHACGQRVADEAGEQYAVVWYIDDDNAAPQSIAWEEVTKDALTGLKNRNSFESYAEKLQESIERGENVEIAIGVFDCDDLKKINDQYGRDKGDLYLAASGRLICEIFKHSPVFRVGGDEFVVILQGGDYQRLEELLMLIHERQSEINASAKNPWEKIGISFGIAVYCPQFDYSVKDLIRRADQLMYNDKRTRRKLSK